MLAGISKFYRWRIGEGRSATTAGSIILIHFLNRIPVGLGLDGYDEEERILFYWSLQLQLCCLSIFFFWKCGIQQERANPNFQVYRPIISTSFTFRWPIINGILEKTTNILRLLQSIIDSSERGGYGVCTVPFYVL